ncbi:unnamed protein product [Linum trigynum]|uniref:Uncharacterized protein n=1 Tax=Linum trigynum TaxID=586398 RepID=A0AAV2GWA5_9ROSI
MRSLSTIFAALLIASYVLSFASQCGAVSKAQMTIQGGISSVGEEQEKSPDDNLSLETRSSEENQMTTTSTILYRTLYPFESGPAPGEGHS